MENIPKQEDINTEDSEEKERKFKRKCFIDRIKTGALIASTLITSEILIKRQINEKEWESHITQSFDVEQKEKIKSLEKELISIFGEYVISEVKKGDERAFFAQGKERPNPSFVDFPESSLAEVREVISEGEDKYPKGWINGQIGSVKLVDHLGKLNDSWSESGEYHRYPIFNSPYVLLLNTPPDSSGISRLDTTTLAHELGHANDWESDLELNLLDRYQLLLDTYKRMMSNDAYHDDRHKDENNTPYHQIFNDGSSLGLYKATTEYWADLCAAYFEFPEGFEKQFPEDYKLVHKIVMKNDPTFDVLRRIKFDPYTGEPREYKKKAE